MKKLKLTADFVVNGLFSPENELEVVMNYLREKYLIRIKIVCFYSHAFSARIDIFKLIQNNFFIIIFKV